VADWDANSPELLRNLLDLGTKVAAAANAREALSSEVIRAWQNDIMRGLDPTDGEPLGVFRGQAGLDDYDVAIGNFSGTPAELVRTELADFDRTLTQQLEELDRIIRRGRLAEHATADNVSAVIILCAWAHGEWVRMHPFPNGNGRTARILVNGIALRYGLPAFLRIRPRPGSEYERVAHEAMQGNWQAAIPVFQRLYQATLAS
jgi:Fic family protein